MPTFAFFGALHWRKKGLHLKQSTMVQASITLRWMATVILDGKAVILLEKVILDGRQVVLE